MKGKAMFEYTWRFCFYPPNKLKGFQQPEYQFNSDRKPQTNSGQKFNKQYDHIESQVS